MGLYEAVDNDFYNKQYGGVKLPDDYIEKNC